MLRPTLQKIDEGHWRQMGREERATISARITSLIAAEIDHAIELGSFDARTDRHLSRIGLVLDERGWHELMAVHQAAFEASFRIARESEERLGSGSARWIEARTVQALFEFPGPEGGASGLAPGTGAQLEATRRASPSPR